MIKDGCVYAIKNSGERYYITTDGALVLNIKNYYEVRGWESTVRLIHPNQMHFRWESVCGTYAVLKDYLSPIKINDYVIDKLLILFSANNPKDYRSYDLRKIYATLNDTCEKIIVEELR